MQAANHDKDVSFHITGLHHFAWRCRNAEETRALYEDVLGLPLVHVIRNESVPSTREPMPHLHIFFQMGDGSYIAFFDLSDETAGLPSPNTPSWANHIAIQVPDEEQLMAAKARLKQEGYEVLGIVNHRIIDSIYFFDPNGLRVEITTRTLKDAEFAETARNAHAALAKWARERSGNV